MSAIRCGSVLASRRPLGRLRPAPRWSNSTAEAFGIEQPAVVRLAAAAGPAMQVDRGNATDAADAFDVDVVTVADRELL